MDHSSKLMIISFLFGCGFSIQAQNAIPVTGGIASGSGGTVSYTVGQLVFNVIAGGDYTIVPGVQQPYEISVVTSIETLNRINLECIIYPNPTTGLLKLIIKPFDHENFRYRLYSLNGILLQDNIIENEETKVSMESFSSSIYILKVIKDKMEVKVFKIVKKQEP